VNGRAVELAEGVLRATFALPFGLDHVHCYLLRGDAGWTAVDTGLGLPDARDEWARALEDLAGPVERIVITHFHPDHVGAAVDLADLTGAPVLQGRLDHAQCLRAWGDPEAPARMRAYLRLHGMPPDEVEALRPEGEALPTLVRFAPDPEPLEPGTGVDGWEVLHLPGHADGHLALLRGGVLVAGDVLLDAISPNIGLYPDSQPDPLGDYLATLARIEELDPDVAYGGHGDPIVHPAGRARELAEHHARRLEGCLEALARGPAHAHAVSLALFPGELPPVLRRFALVEARAHLERLVAEGAVARREGGGLVRYERA
jgi:glyoxylase-like metal-dependent hydrolase (beta-lactamase superfamily II)